MSLQTTLCYLEDGDRYLLLHRTKKENDENHDKWIGVGGKFEDGESPEDCLLREVREETGLTLTHYRYRGIVTFVSDRYPCEYMHLFTAHSWTGKQTACDEGDLAWIEKSRLREDICGSISSVKSISDRELFEAHNTFYLPSNMILSLCGHFDPDRVLAILDRTLPQTLFTRPEKKPLEDPLPPQCRKRSDRVYADITTPVVAIGIKGTPQNALSEDRLKRFNAMSVLASALFSSWGELVTGLTKDNLIPSDPSYEVVHTGAFSHILFSADTYEPKELIGRFDRLAEKISRQGISEEAFQRGKKVLYADYLSEFNSAEGIASLLASDALEGIDTAKSTESILALRKEEVECLAKDLLTNSRICRVTVWPLGEKSKHPQKGA